MMQQPTRVLVIGQQSYWLNHWQNRPELELAGIVDPDIGRSGQPDDSAGSRPAAGQQASELSPVFESAIEVLQRLQPDAVLVVTPPNQKTDILFVEAIVRLGYDVFLEKLRPAYWSDGRKLLDLQRETGRQIGIGESYRFDRLVERIKQTVESGALGRVEQVEWRCQRPILNTEWAQAYSHVMLEDLTYHHMGVLHYVLGLNTIRSVFAVSRQPSWMPGSSPVVVSLLADGEYGLHIDYHASWAAHGKTTSWLGNLRIEGAYGVLTLEGGELTLIGSDGQERRLEPAETPAYELRDGVADAFIRAKREGRLSELDISRMYPVIRLIEAALESVRLGVVVRV